MNSIQWQKIQLQIKNRLLNNLDLVLELEEEHKGGFLALLDRKGNLIAEAKKVEDNLTDLGATIKELTDDLVSQNISIDIIKECIIQLCVVKGVDYLRNPLEWELGVDGICFQWGNKYRGYMMPYEMKKMGTDKIRILDRLCSHKIHLPSSFWRVPEGLCFSIRTDWFQ